MLQAIEQQGQHFQQKFGELRQQIPRLFSRMQFSLS
jgi:hypothetical protein